MANPEHLSAFEKGSKKWKEYCLNHKGETFDLSNISIYKEILNNYEFTNTSFSRSIFCDCVFNNVTFVECDFYNTDFERSDLMLAHYFYCDLTYAKFHMTNIFFSHFRYCNLYKSDMFNTNLINTFIRDSKIRYSDFDNSSIIDCPVYNVDFSDTTFREAYWGGILFQNCDISRIHNLSTIRFLHRCNFDLLT